MTNATAATHSEPWNGFPVPPGDWGSDHLTTLLYIETCNVDRYGVLQDLKMRGIHERYPTMLARGRKLSGHGDWDCVSDFEHFKIVTREGDKVLLTDLGWSLSAACRRHLGRQCRSGGRTIDGFDASRIVPVITAEQVAASQREMQWTPEELAETVALMRTVIEQFYWICFRADIGGRCHPFLEFCGIMQKYAGLCERAAQHGFAFPAANNHSGIELPMESHDLDYFAEKFCCIFGPWFAARPDEAARFVQALKDGKH